VQALLESIKFFIIDHGPLAIFLIGLIEELVFFIPSSPIFITAGFFLTDPQSSFTDVFLQVFFNFGILGASGLTLGSYFIYYIFYYGGKPFILRFGKYVGVSWQGIERFEEKMKDTYIDEWTIFSLRAIPILPITFVSVFAGLIRIHPREFGLFTFLGAVVRLTILGLIGWAFGEAYSTFIKDILEVERYGSILVILIVLACLYYLLKKRKSF